MAVLVARNWVVSVWEGNVLVAYGWVVSAWGVLGPERGCSRELGVSQVTLCLGGSCERLQYFLLFEVFFR